jgi:magnesium-transporting ATPase (P-type)
MKKGSRKLVGCLFFFFFPCLCPFSIGAELCWCIFFPKKKKSYKKKKRNKKGIKKKRGCWGCSGQQPQCLFFFFFFLLFTLYNFPMTLMEKLPEFVGNELFVTHTSHITTMSDL